jgi:hypothetical protein
MAEPEKKKPQHRATYARDKKKGGYLVRIIGPHAAQFAGRSVPVHRMNVEEPTMETLDRLIWSGVDEGFDDKPGTGLPAALYSFKAKPREDTEIPF